MRDYLHPTENKQRLCERLRKVIVDAYQRRNKASRNHPHKKKEKPHGPPKILRATKPQRQHAQSLIKKQPKGLTA